MHDLVDELTKLDKKMIRAMRRLLILVVLYHLASRGLGLLLPEGCVRVMDSFVTIAACMVVLQWALTLPKPGEESSSPVVRWIVHILCDP